jgi:4-hydroxybenzoate polyprenyltransferase
MIFVRPREWWYYKLPLSILLALLLLVGTPVSFLVTLALLGSLVVIISLVANFGHAINELFDRDEDRRGGRANVATIVGTRHVGLIAVGSAIGALAVSYLILGPAGVLLTGATLTLPLAYSVPPLRLKHRKWWGILADATAAHLYPALLCLLIATHWSLRGYDPWLQATVALWAIAAGLRGILSHQLHSKELDRKSGLATVAHTYGRQHLSWLISYGIVPAECLFLAGIIVQVNVGVIFVVVVVLYLIAEALKAAMWRRDTSAFKARPYLPFLDNAFYEVWGPLGIMLEFIPRDPLFAVLLVLVPALFWRRWDCEWNILRGLARSTADYIMDFRGTSHQSTIEGADVLAGPATESAGTENAHSDWIDDIPLLRGADGVDANWYRATYRDIRDANTDPVTHYSDTGWREGRDPNCRFSTADYLEANPDVAQAKINPMVHFLRTGRTEGRLATGSLNILRGPGGVDAQWYSTRYPDIGSLDAARHYHNVGWREGRDPNRQFSTRWYLANNLDVARANCDPLLHYLQGGRAEGRSPCAIAVFGAKLSSVKRALFFWRR